MSDTTNLTDLIQQSTQHLQDLNYSKGTIYQYQLVWKHLQTYAKTKDYENFTLKLGRAF